MGPGGPNRFMEFWAYYLRQEKMAEAQRACAKVIQAGVRHELLVEAAKHWALAKGHLLHDAETQRFFPYAHNWLKNKSYLDKPAIPKPKSEARSAEAPKREASSKKSRKAKRGKRR